MTMLTGTGAAAATVSVDDSGYSEEQKLAAEQKAAKETAERTCDLFAKGPLARSKARCVEAMSSQFTRTAMPALAGTALCNVLTGPVLLLKAVCLGVLASQMDQVQGWFWDAYEVALGAAQTAVEMLAFVANPASAVESWANQVKQDAVGLFTSSMTVATQLGSFDATAEWWRSTYAATAGIGLAVLAVMVLLTLWQASTGRIGPEESARTLLMYLPVGALMLFMGPPVAWAVQWVADGLSAGAIAWMGPDTVEFLQKAGTFTSITSGVPGGLGMGLLLFGMLFLAGVGVLGTFLIQTISIYILGAVTGISWGMLANPRWRSKALRLPMVWIGLVLAKPAMLLVLGVVMKFSNAVDLAPTSLESGMRAVVHALMVVLALMFVAFAPWTLLKWFPLLPDGSESARSSGPVALGAAVGAAGSMATMMAMNRARADSASPGRGTRPGGSSTPAAPNVGSRPAAAMAASAPQRGPGTAAGARGGGVGPGARAGAGRGAGAAATGAGRGAAGAATGGAMLAAMLASQAAQAAVSKARESANTSAPDIRGGEV
ncbi:hypothetical protein [Actinotalea sp. K2]|uniref:hypothetical protein n=1 Tax=Actinotalea sp. K2 TaxID=2939438 RepID=UPI002017B523|nr:hypothetical protein [Actinotalea sp. K2]MCL3863028.1 hypothetical protein [Actinotalea sp. K2]